MTFTVPIPSHSHEVSRIPASFSGFASKFWVARDRCNDETSSSKRVVPHQDQLRTFETKSVRPRPRPQFSVSKLVSKRHGLKTKTMVSTKAMVSRPRSWSQDQDHGLKTKKWSQDQGHGLKTKTTVSRPRNGLKNTSLADTVNKTLP